MRLQNTIKEKITFNGKGLHSGKSGGMTLKPAPEDTGIVFVYNDHREKHFIPFNVDNVVDTQNNISVSNGKAIVKTVEHLTAALYGMKVDNCIIELDTTEIPIMDGSSRAFSEAIRDTGIVQQAKNKEMLRIINPVWVTSEDKFIVALPYDGLKLNYTISFPNSPIGTQSFNMEFDEATFIKDIAAARTFGFIEDLDYYRKHGLVLGGDFENIHVFSKQENRSLNSPRYGDEPVRHKILDLIGVLPIFNFDIRGFIISYKGGHTLDIKFAKRVVNMVTGMEKTEGAYQYDIDTSYYYALADILELEKFPS
jgi:UDP-3-O-acyl N-acetylglucosamine deacetylase